MAAAYAALASLSNTIDRLQHHPFPPISLDEQQVDSLTGNAIFLEEFLQGYNSPFSQIDGADPLESRIADAARAIEAAIESYIAQVIILNGVMSCCEEIASDEEISCGTETDSSSDAKIDRGEEIVSEEETISHHQVDYGEGVSCGDEIDSGEEIDHEEELSCGDVIDSGEKIDFEEQLSCGDEIDSGEELGYGDEIDSGEKIDCGEETKIDSEEEIDCGEQTISDEPTAVGYGINWINFYQKVEQRIRTTIELLKLRKEINSRKEIDYTEQLGSVEEISCINFYQDLQQLVEGLDLIKLEVMEIVEEKKGVQNQLQRTILGPFDAGQNVMVGFDDVLLEVLDKLTWGRLDRRTIPIMGMGGIGKTTLAGNIYAHPLIKEHFDTCAWVTISQQYNIKDIVWELLSQTKNERKEQLSSEMCEDEVGLALYKCLSGRRYLIVMDDMWSIEAWDKIQYFFPVNNNGSRIVVTTRLSNLGSKLDNNCGLEMGFLDEANSWNMFSKIVFGEESCPLELEEIGKEIVANCRGLPLSIVVTGGLLRKFGHTLEWWKSIKKNINSMVNSENCDHCLKMLKMSYDHLPLYLKPCFLYMGVFEKDFGVKTLIGLWISEGFIKPTRGKSLETIGEEYLKELIARNLVLVDKFGCIGNIKNYKIHDLLRDLCQKEAQEEGFYDVLGISSPRFINSRHCDVSQSDECFPKNAFQGINLRYFDVHALWMPAFLSLSQAIRLWNLHVLISYDSVKGRPTFEIWKMPQLRHVHFKNGKGIRLSDPPPSSKIGIAVVMENLQTLRGARNFKCSEEVVKRLPNIKKLGIRYRKFQGVWPDGDYYCLKNLEHLGKLESLHCLVECTITDKQKLTSPHSFNKCRCNDHLQKLTFPHFLKKLTLEVCRSFHLEDVLEKIGSLPLLQKLKLRGGYFRTCKWK